MAGDPTVFLLKSYTYLPAQTADSLLGRIVKNFHSPLDNSVQPPENCNMYDVIPMEYQKFKLDSSSNKKSWASILAEHIAKIRWVGEGDSKISLEGKRIWSRRLQEHDEYFEAAMEDEKTEKKVSQWVSSTSSHICLIVGVYLCEDVQASNSSRQATMMSGEGQLPAATAASTVAGSPTPITTGDLRAEGGRQAEAQQNFHAAGSGKYVFGLELKLVQGKKWYEWYKATQLKLVDKAPKNIAGRTLGPEDSKAHEVRDSATADGDIDVKLYSFDDLMAKTLYEACPRENLEKGVEV